MKQSSQLGKALKKPSESAETFHDSWKLQRLNTRILLYLLAPPGRRKWQKKSIRRHEMIAGTSATGVEARFEMQQTTKSKIVSEKAHSPNQKWKQMQQPPDFCGEMKWTTVQWMMRCRLDPLQVWHLGDRIDPLEVLALGEVHSLRQLENQFGKVGLICNTNVWRSCTTKSTMTELYVSTKY